MRAKALLYRLGEETGTGRGLRAILAERRIPALTVGEAHLGETVERLVSSNAAASGAPVPETVPEEPFLLLCALGDRQLDRLLADLRRAGVSVPCKAILTEHNRSWTLCKLITEVSREHRMMKNS